MISSIKHSKNASHRISTIANDLQQCRVGTLALFDGVDDSIFCRQAHLEFSPVGWHLGHIAYIESLWILERSAGMPPLFPQYRQLFAADGLPKTERVKLPSFEEVQHYLNTVREKALLFLTKTDLGQQERLWRWLIQHESQHSEIVAFILQLQRWDALSPLQTGLNPHQVSSHQPRHEMIEIPAGEFEQGSNSIEALDNERPCHRVYLETYLIDQYPVTCRQYRTFIEAGGYQNPDWWSNSGWKWLQSQSLTQPLYWTNDPTWDCHPVYGVSWYEAEAYARSVGKRLPTEAEWEKAASWDVSAGVRRTYPWGEASPFAQCNHFHLGADSHLPSLSLLQTTPVDASPSGQSAYGCYDLLGNVWEWTASVFQGYDGFVSYPYKGYSQVYFDGEHRVLKGGSWATRPWALRCSFRNWYHPGVRQILAGFRCASGGL